VRDPLAVTERDDRDADRDPDEDELEEVVAERAVADGEDVCTPRIGGDEGERAAHPERVRHPVEDGGDPAVEAPERELHPLVRAALHREGATHLRHDEHVRRYEDERKDDEPKEPLGTVRRDRAERVEPDERAHGEEHHVEMAERLDELALLVQSKRRGLFDCDSHTGLLVQVMRCQASARTSPRIPTISENSSSPATSGGEIWTTGSPRSSARQMSPCSKSRGERNPRRSVSDSSWSNVSRVSLSFTSSSAHRYPVPRRSPTMSSSSSV